jgi:hypothetical protein
VRWLEQRIDVQTGFASANPCGQPNTPSRQVWWYIQRMAKVLSPFSFLRFSSYVPSRIHVFRTYDTTAVIPWELYALLHFWRVWSQKY